MCANVKQTKLNLAGLPQQNPPSPLREREDWAQVLAFVNQISQTLTTSLHLMDISSICRAVLSNPGLKRLFQFDLAEICLWNNQTRTLTTALRLADHPADVHTYEHTYRVNEGYAGWIAANQKSLLIGDTHHFPDIKPRVGLADFPYRSYLGVPLNVGLKFLGTLELAATPPNIYNEQDVAILEIFANQTATAIDYVRLFQGTQRNVVELSLLLDASRELSSTLSYDELLHNLSQQMMEAFPIDDCAIFSFDEAAGNLKLVHQNRGPASDNAEEPAQDLSRESFSRTLTTLPAWRPSFKTQTPLIIRSDVTALNSKERKFLKQWNYGAIVAIPLVSRNKVTGFLVLFSSSPSALTEDQIRLAQSLAYQANIAMENARLFSLTDQQLQKRLDELAGLQRVSSELNSTLDLDRILSLVLEEAMRVTQADLGNVSLYDADSGDLVAHKEQGWTDDTPSTDNRALRASPVASASREIMEQALRTDESILIPDVLHDENYTGLKTDTRSRVVVPVYYGGEPAGVINLESKQINFFNRDQLRYLEALANQAAVAIGNAQAYQEQIREREQASRRAEQLSKLAEISNIFRSNRPLHDILEDIAYAIVESVGYNVVLISLVQGDPPMIYHEVGAGIPIAQFEELRNSANARPLSNLQDILREEFRLSQSYFIPAEHSEAWEGKLDVAFFERPHPHSSALDKATGRDHLWHTGDALFVPLTDTDDNIIGLITVEHPDTDERPTISSIPALEIFANHAATAIENARLFELEQQRRRLADTMRGVAEAISAQLEFDELLNVVLPELANVVDYDSTSVQRLQEDSLVIIGGHGWEDSQEVLGLSFPMDGDNPNRVVIETQEPVIVKDVRIEYPASFSGPLHDRIRSWLGVPLTYGTNLLGLLALDSTQEDFFTQEDAEVALAFANQVAVAMQNARLFEEARQQVRRLAALTEVAQALNRALDLNEVLNLVLDAVFDLVGHSQGSIWLVDSNTNTVKIANTKNISDMLVELVNESAISVDSEPFASVIKSGEVLVVEGSAAPKDYIADYGLPFPDDVTYVPLKTELGVIGILAIENVIHEKNMQQLVTALADLAAVAIDSTRLLEDTRQRANEMQHLYNLGVAVSGMLEVQQVMSSVINNAISLTDTQIGIILFWDEEGQEYVIDGAAVGEELTTGLGLGEIPASRGLALLETEELREKPAVEDDLSLWLDLAKRVMDGYRPIIINVSALADEQPDPGQTADAEAAQFSIQSEYARSLGIQAMLGVPIRVQNQTNGAIFVSSLAPRNFNDHDIQLLSFVANQAAVAVRNAQLVQRLNLLTEELEQRVAQRTEELARTLQDLTDERDRVETLYQITRELSASFDLDRILIQALSLINRAVGISHGSILLLNRETGNLVYRASLGRDKPLPQGGYETKYKLGYGLAGKIMETRHSRIVPDLLADPDWIPDETTSDRRSAIAVPLISGEEVVGSLLLFHPEVGYFTEDHLKLVTAAGAQVATAINNAELYRLITDQADRLGVMLRTQAAETAKNEAILRGIADGVLVLDTTRHIVLLNPKAAEILEIDPTRLENQPLRQILGRPATPTAMELTRLFYNNLLNSLAQIEAGRRSAEFRIDAGNKAVVVTLSVVSLAAEESPSIVAVLRDISREAEVERLKNEFISTVSHELRTPMTSIKGYADLLISAGTHVGELNPTQHRFVKVIQSNANRLTDLVNDILEISRIETGRVRLEFGEVDVIDLIKEVAISFEGQLAQKKLTLSLDLPDSLPNTYADRARVVQILVNLIGNAWQYTPEGGRMTVRAKVPDDRFVQIDVEDTGIGIPEKDLEYIFDRFYRSERTEVQVVDGTGLGLPITKSLIEMLGGQIWVESELDVGTTFSFTLPVKPQPGVGAAADKVGLPDGAKLLIVDDDAAVIRMLRPKLEKVGYQVITTDKADEAFEIARNSSQTLHLIMLDPLLREVDSFELLTQLQNDQATSEIPVLIASVSADENNKNLALEVVDYVVASFEESRILESIKRALDKSDAAQTDSTTEALSGKRYGTDSARILVINDNYEASERFKETLEAGGYRVQRAFNSQQALDMAASKPDLILLDAKMPEVDGETVIHHLRHAPEVQGIPIIVIIDRPLPTEEDKSIRMFGRGSQANMRQSFPVEILVGEIMQVDHDSARSKAQG